MIPCTYPQANRAGWAGTAKRNIEIPRATPPVAVRSYSAWQKGTYLYGLLCTGHIYYRRTGRVTVGLSSLVLFFRFDARFCRFGMHSRRCNRPVVLACAGRRNIEYRFARSPRRFNRKPPPTAGSHHPEITVALPHGSPIVPAMLSQIVKSLSGATGQQKRMSRPLRSWCRCSWYLLHSGRHVDEVSAICQCAEIPGSPALGMCCRSLYRCHPLRNFPSPGRAMALMQSLTH